MLWDPVDCSPPGSSVHGISQARIMECNAISFSRESAHPRDGTCVSCIGRWILYHWATWESLDSKMKRKPLEDREHPLYSQSHVKVQSPIFPMPTGPSASLWPWVNPRAFSRLSFPIFIFLIFFLMWTIFKVFIEFITMLLLSYLLMFWPEDMWGLNSQIRDQTRTPCTGSLGFCLFVFYFLIEG